MQQKILILLAHPAVHQSKINQQLSAAIKQVPGVTVHDLYEMYPDFYINVKREQDLLRAHDIVAFMHPIYWYSVPALLKEWMDRVLEYGFAYGEKGTALHGKTLLSIISAGDSEAVYQPTGKNRHTMQQLLAPISQTASFCGMHYLPPFVVYDAFHIDETAISEQAASLKRLLVALQDQRLDYAKLDALTKLNLVV
jgi:glutathione-regulated potassium-efflux system ancillary protein KefG